MKRIITLGIATGLAVPAALTAFVHLRAEEPKPVPSAPPPAAAAPKPPAEPAKTPPMGSAVKPKDLTDNVKRGLAYLAGKQQADGGWGQGEESEAMGASGAALAAKSNVADTCVAALAFIRAGNTPSQGEYSKHILKAVEFVCGSVEKSDKESLFITDVRGTRVQGKIGQYIDTFTASLLLAEVKGKMPDAAAEKRAHQALGKVVGKMERNQKADGKWSDDGWAAAVGQGIAAKGLNRAAQAGQPVAPAALALLSDGAQKNLDAKGEAKPGGDAGVKLYAQAGTGGALRDSLNTLKQTEEKDCAVVTNPTAPAGEKAVAQARLDRGKELESADKAATQAVIEKVKDPAFVAGFGNNGGEEFLSYMNISEQLAARGGAEWEAWDKKIGENISRVQNKDGSWTGHHCITGRTFCTATVLLTLMADRAPVPVAAQIKK